MTPEHIVEQFSGQTFSTSQEVRAWLLKGIASAIAAEREACAKIADDHLSREDRSGYSEHGSQCLDYKCNRAIAKAIRARSTEA